MNGESQTIIDDLVTDEAGNKILYFYERKNWYDAKKHCESLGGSLPTVETKTKNVEVRVASNFDYIEIGIKLPLTLTRPLRKKLRMKWFFDVSKVKESSFFFKSNLTEPLRFLMRIFRKYQSKVLISILCFESDGFIIIY